MSLDRERLTKLTGSLRASMRLLKEVAILPKAEFLSDAHKQSSAKYNFIAAIEAIIDLAGHWAARAGLRSPKDYADTFQVLFEAGYLGEPLADDLKKMARFRNRLVHLYWEIDPEEIYRILETEMKDFDLFLQCVASVVEAEKKGG
ncbi:MAG: DUF86 domain-containing protein [Coprothermobacterota bacterium]|jgi:uncharacterized protein YutE (UPF0331/DUF86 family)|nr:DUF86 domain-containing protein [Coprothermobacterota bacterium]